MKSYIIASVPLDTPGKCILFVFNINVVAEINKFSTICNMSYLFQYKIIKLPVYQSLNVPETCLTHLTWYDAIMIS